MIEIVLVPILATALFIGPALIIRALARIPFYWTFNPANTFNIVISEEDELGDGATGGNITDALHGISGKWLDKSSSSDPMNWELKLGDDPEHEAWLYRTLGVQSMGSIFHTTRLNTDRRMRFAREKDQPEEELHTVTKAKDTKNVFYTGELTVVIKEADTADKLGINFEIDFAFERQFPVRSVLRLADSAAFLTSLVEKTVNNATVDLPASAYIGGEQTEGVASTRANRDRLVKYIEDDPEFSKKVLDAIGFNITAVSLRNVSMTPEHRKFLELKVKAEMEAEAKVITAGGDRDAQVARNTGDADRVRRVIKPAAENNRTVAVRFAEALENNNTLTSITFAPGMDKMLPVGSK